MDELKMELDLYEREIAKDHSDIDADKTKFIRQVKAGMGDRMKDFESYKKKTPSKWKIFWRKVKKVLWNV